MDNNTVSPSKYIVVKLTDDGYTNARIVEGLKEFLQFVDGVEIMEDAAITVATCRRIHHEEKDRRSEEGYAELEQYVKDSMLHHIGPYLGEIGAVTYSEKEEKHTKRIIAKVRVIREVKTDGKD